MTVLDRVMVAVALATALWWALSRRPRPAALEALSFAALALALASPGQRGARSEALNAEQAFFVPLTTQAM